MNQHVFLSYSRMDGGALADRVCAALETGDPPYEVWSDRTGIHPGMRFSAELDEAIKSCRCVVYLMTPDSVSAMSSYCPNEIARAGRYRRPVVPVLTGKDVVPPLDMETVQYVDMTTGFDAGLAALRAHLVWLDTPKGELNGIKYRLAWLKRNSPEAREEIARLTRRMAQLEEWLANPRKTEETNGIRIDDGIILVRQGRDHVSAQEPGRFINSDAFASPSHFQDRHAETKLAIEFLRNPDKRLLTIIGGAGVGKTGMACRLLKEIEKGRLPDEAGTLAVDGFVHLVYLSEQRSRHVCFPNLFEDVVKVMDPTAAAEAEKAYREPQTPTAAKMKRLISLLPKGMVVVLLDNFEDLLNEHRRTQDRELLDALTSWIQGPPNNLKVIITTRFAPVDLSLIDTVRCSEIHLDAGLVSPHAENLLKQLDADGAAGLRSAPPEKLTESAARVRGYPRALEALYAVLRGDPNTKLDELLDQIAAVIPEKTVETMVGEAFARLDRHEKILLQALAVFNRPVPAVALDYLLQPFVPAVESFSALRWLVDLQIVRKDGDRYYLHPVDAGYALAQVPEGTPPNPDPGRPPTMTRRALYSRAAEYFREIRKPESEWKSIEDLEPQLAEFDLLLRGGRYDPAARLLLAIGFEHLRAWGHVGTLIQMHEKLRGRIEDLSTTAHCLGALGSFYWDTGQLSQAVADLRACIALTEQSEGPMACGAWWCDLGLCLGGMGRPDEALAAQERALSVDHHTGDRAGIEIDLDNCAECYGELGLTEPALRLVRLAVDAIPYCHGPGPDPEALSIRLGSMVKLLLDAGQWPEACARGVESLRLAQVCGLATVVARAGYYLALAALSVGDLKQAAEAARLPRDSEYPRFRFRALLLQGIVALGLNQKEEAQKDFASCLHECEDLLKCSREHYMARVHLALARCGLFVCGNPEDLQTAKDLLLRDEVIRRHAGIRSRCLHLLRLLAAHDPSRHLNRLALMIEGATLGLAPPEPAVPSILEHEAVRSLRAMLVPERIRNLHDHGLFAQCADLTAEGEAVAGAMAPHQRREYLRVRAWAQARRGFLDGPAILAEITEETYLKSLLRVSDYMAVYRFQGLSPAVEFNSWIERRRELAAEDREASGVGVLLDEYHGCFLLASGQTAAAQELLQKALSSESAGMKDVRIMAQVQAALGETCRLRGDLGKAERFLETAAAFQEEHGFEGDLCEYTLPQLAKLRAGQPAAIDTLRRAAECAERLRHRKASLRISLIEARIGNDGARAEVILAAATAMAAELPAVAACPLWKRIRESWPTWCGGTSDPGADYWGL